jgi:hypothetical protein
MFLEIVHMRKYLSSAWFRYISIISGACIIGYFIYYYMPRTRYSEIKIESAEIKETLHVPETTDTTTVPVTIVDADGGVSVSIETVTTTIPEKWLVTFKCSEHQKVFTLDCKPVYDLVKAGDEVTLHYVDEIRYFVKHPEDEQVVDQHTKTVIVGKERIDR